MKYEGPKVKKLTQTAPNLYEGQYEIFKAQLAREYGETPNGNPVGGRWVLRVAGQWMDVDQFRTDLAERHGIELVDGLDYL